MFYEAMLVLRGNTSDSSNSKLTVLWRFRDDYISDLNNLSLIGLGNH